MKIIVFGDTHGFEPKIKNKSLADASFILSTGDYWAVNKELREFQLKNNNRIRKLLETGMSWQEAVKTLLGKKKFDAFKIKDRNEWQAAIRRIVSFGKPVFFVFGNADIPFLLWRLSKNISNFISVHGKLQDYGGLKIIGIGDYIRPVRNNAERKIKEFERKIEGLLKVTDRKKVVILSHYPPYGILDEVKKKHRGLIFLKYIIKKYKPFLFICGHIHERQGMIRKGNTYIINAGTTKDGGILVKIREDFVSLNYLK